MEVPDRRRLAAIDMYGTHGSVRRRRMIRAEFSAGAVVCTLLGVVFLAQGSLGWILAGVWLLGVGANYLPLAVEARRLARPGALAAAIAGLDLQRELRRATRAQLWLFVPFSFAGAALARSRA